MGKEHSSEEIQVMDTPDRCKNNQIAASACKFEESPIFSFLNSLSPIQPVKSTHISQTINPLTFASLPSVFTSPHLTSLKKEYRYLQRQLRTDPSKLEFSTDNGSIDDKSNVNADAAEKSEEQNENRDGETAAQPSYNYKSPDSNFRSISALKPKSMVEYTCSSSAALFVDEASQRGLSERKENLRGVALVNRNKDGSPCDWDSLISDATDMLIFESPNITDPYNKYQTSFYTSNGNDVPNTRSPGALASGEQVGDRSTPENLFTQPGEGSEMMENAEIHDINNPSEKSDFEQVSGFYRGMRRRCLVFEMAEARRKQLEENTGSDSSLLLQSNNANTLPTDQQLVSAENESLRRLLPGIGLHLNVVGTTTPKNYKLVRYEAAYRSFYVGTSSSVNNHPPITSQEMLNNNNLAVIPPEREYEAIGSGVLPVENACDASEYIASEDINQSCSPKKKRRRPELAMEGEACKRCNCKKSKCLKLYCECFAAGVYCVEPCACIDCFNKPVHEDTVLATRKQIESRNPLAFAPKVIRSSESALEATDNSSKTPASARHKRGCNCKKSGCLKKYCECYQGGVGCSIGCRCEGCKNAFGRKDGSYAMGAEVEFEQDGTETTEESVVENSLKRTAGPVEMVQNPNSIPHATPLRATRQSVSKNKPPRASFISIGSSSSFVPNAFNKPSMFQPSPKLDSQFETVWEDEIPEFLQGSSPNGGIKSSSPNQKRVSPPQSLRRSPGLRSSRKLILQSIPSFPSLGPTH